MFKVVRRMHLKQQQQEPQKQQTIGHSDGNIRKMFEFYKLQKLVQEPNVHRYS